MTRFVLHGVLAVALLAGVGACRKKARTIDPDAEARVEGTGIESRDVRAVVAQMKTELLASGSLTKGQPPKIAVLPVENRSRFLIDQDIFTTLLTDQLIQNAGGQLAIVNRDLLDQILRERDMKAKGQVSDDGQMSALAGVDYFLEGEVRSLSASTNRAQTDYVVIRFQLTDAETGIVGWSNSYEMKKEGSWGVMYQ
jgi:TolB-like protein